MKRSSRKQPRLRLEPAAYRQLAREVLARDGWRCQDCGSFHNLQVHHIRSRSRLGNDVEGRDHVGGPADALALGGGQLKTHVYVEGHEGAGDVGNRAFHYNLAALGLISQLTPELSWQLEERYIDIDTSHGSLPKLGLTYRVVEL